MLSRLQQFQGDTVLEIVDTVESKTRLSEKEQLRKRDYLAASIANFQKELEQVESDLAKIYAEKGKR